MYAFAIIQQEHHTENVKYGQKLFWSYLFPGSQECIFALLRLRISRQQVKVCRQTSHSHSRLSAESPSQLFTLPSQAWAPVSNGGAEQRVLNWQSLLRTDQELIDQCSCERSVLGLMLSAHSKFFFLFTLNPIGWIKTHLTDRSNNIANVSAVISPAKLKCFNRGGGGGLPSLP